jgi:hypothetical protein
MIKDGESGWVKTFEFNGRKVVNDKVCEDCKGTFKTHNEACWHVAKVHPEQLRHVNGDVAVVKVAMDPFNNRERTLSIRTAVLYKGEIVDEARFNGEEFAQGAAWAFAKMQELLTAPGYKPGS